MEVKNGQDNDCRTDESSFNDINEVTYAGVAPHPPIKIEHEKDKKLK
jgi:hypothetical protein